ncbi:acyl-CoA desaturase [Pontixanthobacter sp. CEM42]|uniref:fatty acid desaturase n=1 Tax=Pontixanthobacter sp. CEM42 TaxID=2792077 RepID=UPI001AE08F86|nr:acyl-CoA desaturase [Pontixanthobacter sp. CEM42]
MTEHQSILSKQQRDRCEVNWLVETEEADPTTGRVVWDPVHSIWNGGMLAAALIFAPLTASVASVTVGLLLTGIFLLLGHSVGFHRLMIHRSFQTYWPIRLFLIWCGTVAGMSGPLWITRTHDLRDWAQRQSDCHDYLAHRNSMLKDAWWQLHCRLELASPPRFDLSELERSRFIVFLERSWMAHQLPLALLLWLAGGWAFVVWGICVRVTLTVHGHWLVGHLAHRRGPQSWIVDEAGVQAHDVPWAGFITMGEAWHNNHHAYPGSAKIGLKHGQSDLGYRFIAVLERIGLAWDVCLPGAMPERQAKLSPIEDKIPTSLQW